MHTKDRSLKANEWSSSHTWMFSSSQKFPGHPLCSPPFPLLLQPKNPSLKKNPLTSKSPLFPCLPYQATTCSHVHHSANASSSPTTMGEPCSWPPVHAASDNQTDSNLTSSPIVVTEQPCNNPKPTHPTTSPSL